ncbi:DNA-directed RNA polymerase [uncultured Reyranella sp.]|uniref:DNA-directed RNA polymerase n=1 Tax=uncultured Reyranella sp. TaxID=735512 RepID=UPI0025DC214F|nr:DNA-directed RNA polymerase [uncultured Reyranella sp.]
MVNLVPRGSHEKPADIYAVVAERAVAILREQEAQLDRYAHYWLTSWGVTRDDTKSSVMTLPYGGTKYGNPAKVQKSIEKQIKAGKKPRPDWLSPSKQNRSEYKRAIKVLSDAIWEAMSEVVRGPMDVMQYVRDCATALKALEAGRRKAATKNRSRASTPNLRLCWTSPCGFPVLTDYRVPKTRRTELRDPATGRKLTFTYYAASAATDWREVVGSAPPHFIHSLDASHLMRSVMRAHAAGIDQIAIVHDAFGTTPSKVGQLAAVLRDEFARMYSEDVLEGTLGKMLEAAGATPPPPPSRGALDVAAIAQSVYLFA